MSHKVRFHSSFLVNMLSENNKNAKGNRSDSTPGAITDRGPLVNFGRRFTLLFISPFREIDQNITQVSKSNRSSRRTKLCKTKDFYTIEKRNDTLENDRNR